MNYIQPVCILAKVPYDIYVYILSQALIILSLLQSNLLLVVTNSIIKWQQWKVAKSLLQFRPLTKNVSFYVNNDRLCGLVESLAADPEVRVLFPALPDFLRSSGSGMGSTQPREYTLPSLHPSSVLSTLISNLRDQVSHPYRTTGKIIVLYSYIPIFTYFDSRREDRSLWMKHVNR
jgi:hypothetical protein